MTHLLAALCGFAACAWLWRACERQTETTTYHEPQPVYLRHEVAAVCEGRDDRMPIK